MDSKTIKAIARAGFAAKGVVYTLLGIIAVMAAFRLNGKSTRDAGTGGVFSFIEDQSGGKIILAILAAGLICYVIWRMIQAFDSKFYKENKIAKRVRYFFSGLAYAALTYQVIKMLFGSGSGSRDSNKKVAGELLSTGAEWLIGILAIFVLAIGIYQIYYGLSEKYRKHVNDTAAMGKDSLLLAGKIGYVARGVVWLLVSYLFFRAAFNENANEAGSTPEAFSYLQQSNYGTILMAVMAAGLICYGIFCFVRAAYEEFT